MRLRPYALAAALLASLTLAPVAHADNKAAVIDEMAAYLDFVDYGGGVIFAEQIPKEEWKAKGGFDAAAKAAAPARH